MRVLTVCAGAVCRSVAMALVLKSKSHDAIALSSDWNSTDTFDMLTDWADRVVLMEPKFQGKIHFKDCKKIRICNVGPDIWKNPLNEDLLDMCWKWVNEGGLE